MELRRGQAQDTPLPILQIRPVLAWVPLKSPYDKDLERGHLSGRGTKKAKVRQKNWHVIELWATRVQSHWGL